MLSEQYAGGWTLIDHRSGGVGQQREDSECRYIARRVHDSGPGQGHCRSEARWCDCEDPASTQSVGSDHHATAVSEIEVRKHTAAKQLLFGPNKFVCDETNNRDHVRMQGGWG